jgi:hypothetical protein
MMSQPTGLSRVLALLVMGCGGSAADRAGPDAGGNLDAGQRADAGVGEGDDDAERDAGRDGSSTPEPGGECRSSDDCADGLLCVGPEENVCGIPPQQECSFNTDCAGEPGTDFRCHAQPDACSRDGIGSVCGEACRPTSCGVGFICQAGGCVPVRCNDGFQCSRLEECEPSSIDSAAPAHALTHGCVPIACTSDEECPDDAVCVNDRCQAEAGTCSLPPP